ncbi:MAG: flagellar motor protein MotA [Lysobacterales bacterium CG17_big_fil_post_rev_8_21_14_2_50_64_11]|nr:MAG: flagellar motor protein MotA [Xanthomonadales bacterium CG17_big_fil_post_rev_8_21_14_2_50_64_11]PIX60376.1 MAG: MotA/TolQ/ExbB proton channel family protein [Xanthomonadales bacterium CG_4_10_14_3_um_filter_64_11]
MGGHGQDSALGVIASYLQAGGVVMPILLLVTVLLWYALGVRWLLLRRGSAKNVRVLLKRAKEGRSNPANGIVDQAVARGLAIKRSGLPDLRRRLDDAFAEFQRELKQGSVLITTLVTIAPLLGLLGTVMGMIVTFESLGDMTLFSQSGGIASGISTALFTTQMGLVVAVPGVIAKSVLDRRQQQIELDLAQITDILVSSPADPDAPGSDARQGN